MLHGAPLTDMKFLQTMPPYRPGGPQMHTPLKKMPKPDEKTFVSLA